MEAMDEKRLIPASLFVTGFTNHRDGGH